MVNKLLMLGKMITPQHGKYIVNLVNLVLISLDSRKEIICSIILTHILVFVFLVNMLLKKKSTILSRCHFIEINLRHDNTEIKCNSYIHFRIEQELQKKDTPLQLGTSKTDA